MKRSKRLQMKRKSRAFYRKRAAARAEKAGKGDVLPRDEAEALRPWRGWGVALAALGLVAAAGWAAAKVFS